MKIAFFLIVAGLGLLWFANYSIQDIGLARHIGNEWTVTDKGWGIFAGLWVLWATVVAAVVLLLGGLVAWFKFDFEEREKKLKEKLVTEKQESIAEIEKIHAKQIENLLTSQTKSSNHLQNAYAEIEQYKRSLNEKEEEKGSLVKKINQQHSTIQRLHKKIKKLDRLEMPRF